MSSSWGETLRLSVFGESHGKGIGVVLEGLPAGEEIDEAALLAQMARRAPGQNGLSTARKESDFPEILSGVYQNRTTGTPLCAVIRNADKHSGDYADLITRPRPGHADYTGRVRYGGFNDPRGGGHFSGRLTAPLVFAGAVCRQILARRGVSIGAHLLEAGGVKDTPFDAMGESDAVFARLAQGFPALSDEAGGRMKQAIEAAKLDGDSVGAIIECMATGVPAGLGEPMFGGVENRMASFLFGIPAVKGVEFGAGFAAAGMRGSAHNDAFVFDGAGAVRTGTNRHGGVLGGITSGMPIVFCAAFKPTPSIFKEQKTVDLQKKEETTLLIHGRHDPCVAVRAVPVVESAAAVVLLDLWLTGGAHELK